MKKTAKTPALSKSERANLRVSLNFDPFTEAQTEKLIGVCELFDLTPSHFLGILAGDALRHELTLEDRRVVAACDAVLGVRVDLVRARDRGAKTFFPASERSKLRIFARDEVAS